MHLSSADSLEQAIDTTMQPINAPTTAQFMVAAEGALKARYGDKLEVSWEAATWTKPMVLVVGDSMLKTNKSRGKGSKFLSARELRQAQAATLGQESVFVACFPGATMSELLDVVIRVVFNARVDRLLLVWQGNEYKELRGKDLHAIVDGNFAALSRLSPHVTVLAPVCCDIFAADYGADYSDFARSVNRVARDWSRDRPNFEVSPGYAFAGCSTTRSHLAAAEHDKLVAIIGDLACEH